MKVTWYQGRHRRKRRYRVKQEKPLRQTLSVTLILCVGSSLMVQWLRLGAANAGGTGSIPGQGTKIPHAKRPKGKRERKCMCELTELRDAQRARKNTVSGVSVRVCVKTVKSTLPRWAGTGKLTGGETLSPDVQPSWLFESAWDLRQRFPWSSGLQVWAGTTGPAFLGLRHTGQAPTDA